MNTTPALPMLKPTLLGENWDGYEGVSSFGVLWRATRFNVLRRSDLRSFLHVTVRVTDDVFARMTRAESQHKSLRFAFPIEDFLETPYWRVEEWWPFGGPIPFDVMGWHLRACVACARSCYHSLLFQMPGIERCPWHGGNLIEHCPKCKAPLLAGFREDLPLGQCVCGHDLVDYAATAAGDVTVANAKRTAIHDYLARAKASRQATWLVAPETEDAVAWRALHHLSSDRSRRSEDVVFDEVRLDRCLKFPPTPVAARSGLESFRPGLAALPSEWSRAFKQIGINVLGMIPRQCLRNVADPQGSVRHAFGQLPAYPCGGNIYLATETLDRAVLRCAGQLVIALGTTSTPAILANAGLSQRLRCHSLGSRLTERVLKRVLTRGYADGIRVALGRHVPELYSLKRRRPMRRLPWVLMFFREGKPTATIAWTRQSGTF